jgi:tagatose-1,6-bisphosphate aldolase
MALDQIGDRFGTFRVLAVDHRDSLRVHLSPTDPGSVSAHTLTAIKVALVQAVSPYATGVMLEPEYSIPQVIDAGALAPGVGFLAALESQGYLAEPGRSPTKILAGWSVEQAAAAGAAAAKLLLPYHPDAPLAAAQEAAAAEVLHECRRFGIPLVLEPLFHGLSSPADRERVVLTTVERFAAMHPDLLKLPFPIDARSGATHPALVAACEQITVRCSQPWVLLSGGGDFDAFARQLEAALEGGCSGFMVGRALWGEAATATPDDRPAVIDELVLPRWHRLSALVDQSVGQSVGQLTGATSTSDDSRHGQVTDS